MSAMNDAAGVRDVFDDFVELAWSEHAEHTEAVAERLRGAIVMPRTGEQVAALARLIVHVFGEHLGRFDQGRGLLHQLGQHAAAAGHVIAGSALRVGIASLAMTERSDPASRDAALAGLRSPEEAVRALATAAAACLGREKLARCRSLFADARASAAGTSATDQAVQRALAVTANNMAWALHDRAERSPEQKAATLDAAAASSEHWAVAGSWLEAECAEHALACCHVAAASPTQGLVHALQCLAICEANAAPPFEVFFANEALARVHRARGDADAFDKALAAMQAAFDTLPPGERADCQGAFDAMRKP